MFHMDQLIRSRRLIRDVAHRWIPFLFVVLTVVISTALLSTGGRPPRGMVVTFGVLAGLLVVVFLACHLMIYCTRIKHDMDAERATKGDDGDVNVPPGFIPTIRSAGTQVPQFGREGIETPSPRPDERRRQNQPPPPPSVRVSSYAPARFSAAQYIPSPLSQVAPRQYSAYRPQSQSTAGPRVSQDQDQDQDQPTRPSAFDQTSRDSSMRHSSAVVAPLKLTRQELQAQAQAPTTQPQMGPGEPPPPPPHPRDTAGDEYILATLHTQALPHEAAAPPRRAPAVRDPAPQHHHHHQGQRPPRPAALVPDYRPRDGSTAELYHGVSAAWPPPPVQARLALLDVWGVLVPGGGDGGGKLRRMSADDCLGWRRTPPWDVAVVRDVGCHRAVRVVGEGEGERPRSLRGEVRWVRVRDSGDSGYYSADGGGGGGQYQYQHPQAQTQTQTQVLPWHTLAALSAASGSGGSWASSPSSSEASEGVGWHNRVSVGDADAVSVVTGRRVRRERQGPLGRSESC